MSRKIDHSRRSQLSAHRFKTRVDLQGNMRPVIQPSSPQVAVREAKTQRFYEMQRSARCCTGPGDIAGILRNLGLIQGHMQSGFLFQNTTSTPVVLKPRVLFLIPAGCEPPGRNDWHSFLRSHKHRRNRNRHSKPDDDPFR